MKHELMHQLTTAKQKGSCERDSPSCKICRACWWRDMLLCMRRSARRTCVMSRLNMLVESDYDECPFFLAPLLLCDGWHAVSHAAPGVMRRGSFLYLPGIIGSCLLERDPHHTIHSPHHFFSRALVCRPQIPRPGRGRVRGVPQEDRGGRQSRHERAHRALLPQAGHRAVEPWADRPTGWAGEAGNSF